MCMVSGNNYPSISHLILLSSVFIFFVLQWVSGCVGRAQASWPVFEVQDIEYSKKGIESLPDSWKVEVSEACQASNCFPTAMDPPSSEVCHIKLTAQGDKCPEGGCTLLRECGNVDDCSTGQPYVSPWQGEGDSSARECIGTSQECEDTSDCCPGLSCQSNELDGNKLCYTVSDRTNNEGKYCF